MRDAYELMVPMVTSLHVPPDRDLKTMRKGVSRSANYPLHKFISVSHTNAAQWKGTLGYKPDVVHNGIDVNKWQFKTEMPEHKFAVWIGRITPEKGLDYAIRACRIVGLDLKIIGPVYDEAYFTKKIQPMLDDKIMYYGHLSHEIINHITKSASVVVMSSMWEEPFGLVSAEALATGTPVAAFRIGATPEIVVPMTGELASVGNEEELADAIRLCLTKDPLKCRESAQQRFSIDTMIDNYEAAYSALLMKKHSTEGLIPTYDSI